CRRRSRSQQARRDLRAVLHDEAARNGHGTIDLSLDRRGARRSHLGHEEHWLGRDVPLHRAARRPGASLNGAGKRIVVVDDDPSVRRGLERVLKSAGYRVEAFASVQDMLNGADLDRAACLVLDVRMPGPSGLDLQAALAHDGSRVPIVFISGHGDVQMAVRAMKSGAVDFLSKPFDAEELFDAIAEAMRRAPRSRQSRTPSP